MKILNKSKLVIVYRYCPNNPVRYIDPSGNSACDAKGKPQGSNKKTISKSHDNTAHDGYYGRKQSRREAYEQGLQPKKAAPKPINNAKEKWKAEQSYNRQKTNGTYFHSAHPDYVTNMQKNGFDINWPSEKAAFKRNRYGNGVYLADVPKTALAERPGGAMLKVEADIGKNLNIVDRGVVGGSDYSMTQAIRRGARKHGYDSITFLSKASQENGFTGINTVVFDPKKVIIKEVLP